ncbi:MAG: pyridoxal 5'-phosphate synthase glutaminase subunit PdxT [Candidatus Poseidoniaceae archaeon]|nr:pyridoxal 5'-phosphate synthase glutaminase subunit PdxT [Candidatus Poseidoniaceae archaeon]
MLTIGLAMLQGARHEHSMALHDAASQLGIEIEIKELRKASDVVGIDALILPGGESTAMKIASRSEDLYSEIWKEIKSGLPVLGTCAGAILLCQQDLVNAEIDRNAFGRQRQSFQSPITTTISEGSFNGVFIRAPRFTSVNCEAIAHLEQEAVGVVDGNRMALTFHPELTDDRRFHRWIIECALNQ